ncbi:hypothetical protein F441_17014 [Phytophthora nicotianae CJ01A1]|uniref:Uncharacterized protein n=6 Tax=Phytophthora nicotianae TaxID=4792 RepID=W2PMJ8_PHYN3|nr:hypothetical protein PPTG_23948 [Phytophthora nicotianae INRA-310]ETI36798.1 hypothetical protein F443_17140 [Phytophthora nicotianae P1569]ETK77007.1 hypothetical protein L915_16682 [Phytophthora nicotianae]ETO65518.1 hypothetical protein F444_17182 [Phytophthora nicotianae P1976]ETP06621.1 hypothetical protein F441_17014 [Phytophthora nicotianae CJ01A1]ETP34705.1 hypothetical protein F442_17015 [Phytophthora nicotianae P10297]
MFGRTDCPELQVVHGSEKPSHRCKIADAESTQEKEDAGHDLLH